MRILLTILLMSTLCFGQTWLDQEHNKPAGYLQRAEGLAIGTACYFVGKTITKKLTDDRDLQKASGWLLSTITSIAISYYPSKQYDKAFWATGRIGTYTYVGGTIMFTIDFIKSKVKENENLTH